MCVFRSRLLGLLACALPALTGAAAAADDPFRELLQPIFQKHCVKCHGEGGKVKGKVNLLEIGDLATLVGEPGLLGDLIDVLEFEEMPPEDEPPLEPAVRGKLLDALNPLLQTSLAQQRRYGQAPLRRMNRFQYNNAVTDLFDVNRVVFALPERMMREHRNYFRPETGKMAPTVTVGSRPLGKSQLIEPRLGGVAPFPQDLRAEHGYDNRGDHLSLSPLLMEAFLELSQSITQSPDFGPKTVGIWNEFFEPPIGETIDEGIVAARLRPFLTRAFRGPVSDEMLARYAGFVMGELRDGVAFPDAMKAAASAAIASPKFLYLYEEAGTGRPAEPLSDRELASRLSFFLWGSLPDGELLELAEGGTLSDPNVLTKQVDRMLRDEKLKRFCDSFPSQWLQLERIISSVPNPDKFPGFYFSKYRDSMHMMLEPLLLFETVLIENLPVTQLIDSDFTYRSPRLELAYLADHARSGNKKGGGVTALNFRRLPVEDRRHGGVITNAAVMTMTSGPECSKPITRGAWLAGVIFNDPPEPPPADVPPLDEKPVTGEENLTLRERLVAHRERADCAGCHEKIDPLGFALENYGPIGTWRDRYENGREVDMQGVLFRKHRFESIEEFKDALLAEKDRFTRGLAGHLLSFALARELEVGDSQAVKQIAAATAADGYRMQTLIKQTVLSEPFRTKSNPPVKDPPSNP